MSVAAVIGKNEVPFFQLTSKGNCGKLLTYALGRGAEYYDMPAVRRTVRDAAANDYRWSSLILGIAKSLPFQMRRAES